MKRPLTIRQFISAHNLSIVALSSDYLSALKVREHDAKQGLRGAFAGVCKPRFSGKFNNKRRNRQPLNYYTQVRDVRHLNPSERFRLTMTHASESLDRAETFLTLDVPSIPSPTENQN